MPVASGQLSLINLAPADTILFAWQSNVGWISTSPADATIRPLYPASSKLPASTTVA
jgi:hypothetical protein